MEYSKTLNLPKTDFPIRFDPAKIEPEILNTWADLKPYETRQQSNKENTGFFIYNSPHPISNHTYLSDILGIVLKDIVVKYKLMRGFSVPNYPGWDCHSPAIEREVLEFLRDKAEVPRSKIQKFSRNLCSEYIDHLKEQQQQLGIFAYWEKPVLTSDSDYRHKAVKAFADLYEAGYLYKGVKPARWCVNCQTDLTESETEYKAYRLLSLYVKFPVIYGLEELGEDVYMLVQTNTPWTLSANTAIAVHPERTYVAIEIESKEVFIVAAGAIENVTSKIHGKYRVVKEMKGLELNKIVYAHPFLDRNSNVFLDRKVPLARGTGCIHTVPESGSGTYAHQGAESISTVDQNGLLTEEAGQFCSLDVFESVDLISLELEKRGCLLTSEAIEQSYPHCSYCGKPTIVRLTNKWIFNMNTNELRKRILDGMDGISYLPDWSKTRTTNILSRRPDWSISRQRIWGIPVPIFYCSKCGSQVDALESLNSSKDTIRRRGASRWFSAKPVDILPEGALCSRCGSREFRWETEMLDTGFVSAMNCKMPASGNKSAPQPVDVCLGGNGHDENWVHLSLLPSMAIDDGMPFKSILFYHKHVDGKASELVNTGLPVGELLNKFGADILRFWIASRNFKKQLRLSQVHFDEISAKYQRIRNTCRFLLSNLSGYEPENDKVDYEYLQEIDRWALHKLTKFVKSATEAYESYQFHLLHRLIYDFCSSDLSSLYLCMIRRRLYIFPRWSGSRRAAQTVIYEILTDLIKIMAPILPFTAEEIWRKLPKKEAESPSVFMLDWPDSSDNFLQAEQADRWEQLLKIRSETHKLLANIRQEQEINTLFQASVILYASSPKIYDLLDMYIDDLEEIFMAARVRLMPPDSPIPEGTHKVEGIDDLVIDIRHIAGEKCERCWTYSDTVRTNEQHPGLCNGCIAILEGGAVYI